MSTEINLTGSQGHLLISEQIVLFIFSSRRSYYNACACVKPLYHNYTYHCTVLVNKT